MLLAMDPSQRAARAADPPRSLRVLTYNLRYASDRPPNAWPARRPVAAALVQAVAPDVIGTQEGLFRQVTDLAADLPQYAWIGLGRDGGSHGEFMAVFYRTERLEPLEYDHFWLSDTPEQIGSTSWGNSNRRMVTWVRFRDRLQGGEFYFANTHFDHEVQTAREKSASLVLARTATWRADLPLVLAGDFNAQAGNNPVYAQLVAGGFADTWNSAAQRGPLVGTFHDYHGPQADGPRIDWILTRGSVSALRSEVVTFARDGQYPSDHFPVLAVLELGAPSR